MCLYITAVLPAAADGSALAGIAARHGRVLKPLLNPAVQARLEAGERYFLTTPGHCDCGTALGAIRRHEEHAEASHSKADAEERKLRRKGWSEAKLARWKAQRTDHEQSVQRKAEREESTLPWLLLLDEMLQSGATPFVGLLLHFYAGSVAEEDVQISNREVLRRSALGPAKLGRTREDVLYEVGT
jgi:hypothetical protein